MTVRVVLFALGTAAVAYLAVLIWFRFNEDSFIFAPTIGPNSAPDPSLGLKTHDVEVNGAGGLKLKARVVPPPESIPSDEAAWLVYLHGSSGSIGLAEYNEAWAVFHQHGLGVFAVDYRGYGESQGEISEAGLYQDAESAYRYLVDEMRIPPQRVVLYGFSLGSAVAIDLATRVDAAGLIVEGALLSVPQLGAERFPFLPAHLIAKNRFASVNKISSVHMPVLFLHARDDQAIPIAHSRALYEKANSPKSIHELGGEHGTSHTIDTEFFGVVTDFVATCGLPTLDP